MFSLNFTNAHIIKSLL